MSTPSKIRKVISDINTAIYNPNAMQDAVLDTLLDINAGNNIEIMDVNNPVLFAVETAVTLAQASIEHQESHSRRRNVIMATDMEDLYGHMSDKDFIDPFAQPSRGTFVFYISKNEVMNKAHPLDGLAVRKLVIPKDTAIVIQDHTFTLQYGIEIRVMPHGGLQVVYDTTSLSPIVSLATNTLDWTITTVPVNNLPVEMIAIRIPALQYKINTWFDGLTVGLTYRNRFSITDMFFHARVWHKVNSKWVELKTTHSVETVDVTRPVAQLRVLGKVLEVHIPDIHVKSGLVSSELRVDVYTTKGKVELPLGNYISDQFVVTYIDISKELPIANYAPLKTLSYTAVSGEGITRGGRIGLTFDELRTRVIDNSIGSRTLPVSEKQLVTAVEDYGLSVSLSIDFVTKRTFLASGDMPASTIPKLSTAIGTLNGIIETDFDELNSLATVRDNGNRVTLTPDTLFKYDSGHVLIDKLGVEGYRRLGYNAVSAVVNKETFLFTPFHYVLDINGNVIESRPYYLGRPSITNKRFIETNATVDLEVSTKAQSLEVTNYGYKLLVVTRSNEVFKSLAPEQRIAQIQFTPRGYGSEYAYLNGSEVGRTADNEFMYEFRIETNLDIDRNHDLIVTGFALAGGQPIAIALQLASQINIVYAVSGYTIPKYREIFADSIFTSSGTSAKAITHEILSITLGMHLPSLWTNSRAVAGSINYERYTEDVIDTYLTDVKETDPITNAPLYDIVEVDGRPKIRNRLLFAAGDPVLDEHGEFTVKHVAGSVKYLNGAPVISEPRKVKRRLELFLLDGKFAFSKHSTTEAYMKTVVDSLLGYVTKDIPAIDISLLEKTSLFFYPRTNLGTVEVLLGDGTTTRIDAELRFKVKFYLSDTAASNREFLTVLSETTRSAILTVLKGLTISVSAITEEIRGRLKGEIIDVELEDFGTDEDLKIVTVKKANDRLTLGKKLVVNPDFSHSIEDDISISYNRHTVR